MSVYRHLDVGPSTSISRPAELPYNYIQIKYTKNKNTQPCTKAPLKNGTRTPLSRIDRYFDDEAARMLTECERHRMTSLQTHRNLVPRRMCAQTSLSQPAVCIQVGTATRPLVIRLKRAQPGRKTVKTMHPTVERCVAVLEHF